MARINLLIYTPKATAEPTTETRFGGPPSVDTSFSWPICSECDAKMQFQGQFRAQQSETLHLIFMCANEDSACSSWEADGGANTVICAVTDNLKFPNVDANGQLLRPTLYGTQIQQIESSDYTQALTDWRDRNEDRKREIIGQIGGEPDWLQADETPDCTHCRKPMRFVAQLEEGPDQETAMNFGGGGCGYLFECQCAGPTGKFLWQC